MLLSHYGFRESPFGVTPDPRYLYASETHREALASLLYGINSGLGFMALVAMPGMGKTTILFEVLDAIRHKAATAFLFQPVSTPVELLRALLTELGISHPQGGLIELQLQLNELLVKQSGKGKRLVVVIDEAQNLNDDVLEQVRMLSNFETSREKLIQIILAGQPQLAERLASPELLQLRQRISIVARLEPLSSSETATYIRHRLTVAGYDKTVPLYNSSAVAMIAQHSEGIPRNINNLCFNALTLGCALRQTTIGSDVVREVIADLDLKALAAGTQGSKTPEKRTPANIPATDQVKPDRRAWQLATVSLVGLLLLTFGFVYMRFLSPGRWNLHSGIPTKIAPQSPASTDRRTAESRVNSETPVAPVIPEDPEISKTPVAPQKVVQAQSVSVRRGQSLHTICINTFGECGRDVFRAFLEANPGISDPDHIVPGQTVFLPSSPSSSNSEARQ